MIGTKYVFAHDQISYNNSFQMLQDRTWVFRRLQHLLKLFQHVSTVLRYHQCYGGFSVLWRDTTSTLVSISTALVVSLHSMENAP